MPESAWKSNEKSIAAMTISKPEWILFSIGLALLGMWGLEVLDSIAHSRVAIARFDVNRAVENSNSSFGHGDQDLVAEAGFEFWPVRRVQAYKASLLEKVDAPLAVLRIPRIHLEVPVLNGTDSATLHWGVGRIEGTAQVGTGSNLAIAGHRDSFFRGLKDLSKGDLIELSLPNRTDFYFIDRIEIVGPEDVSVLKATRRPSLTLITCFPFVFVGSAPQRYVVRASILNSTKAGESSVKNSISTGNKIQPKGE